jgi:flagellar hook-basal body complex protein FliE
MDNSINQVLGQMQAIEAMAKSQARPAASGADDSSGQFADLMARAINQVNQSQAHAAELSRALERGDPTVDIAEVMVAMQKSRVSFQALTEVRNKLLTAYQDIMNMPV